MRRFWKLTRAAALLAALFALVMPGPAASAATLTEVTNFGPNPGNLRMYLYVPNALAPNPGVVVAMHGCNGTATGFYQSTEFASLADRYGFIVIYPQANKSIGGMTNCFDVWSNEALRHDGGSDPVSIVSMVRYVLQRYNADPERVFATGFSSGAMETNNLLATYPDVFKAGAPFAGIPYGCFGPAGCGDKTPQQWGDLVRNAYPGYTGPRPRVMTWHGTNDNVLNYGMLQEQVDQWTNVFGISQTPTRTEYPQPNWVRRVYGSGEVEAWTIQGAGHDLPHPGMAAYAISFFGLDGSTPAPPTSPSPSQPPVSPSPSPSQPPAGRACEATYALVNQWPGGFQAEVTVKNTGSSPINGWTVQWTLPSGQSIIQLWNGDLSTSGSNVTVRNVSWNGNVPAGGSTSFGFLGSGTGQLSSSLTCTAS